MLTEMHELWERGYTPKVKAHKGCNACSLKEICIPRLGRSKNVNAYIQERLMGE
jgi:CRISPR-associated exonuclease Cas4